MAESTAADDVTVPAIDPIASAAFADAFVRACADRATVAAPHHADYAIAGAVVRVDYDGSVAPFLDAFDHLRRDSAPADLTIRVATQVTPPAPPWRWSSLKGRGELPAADGWLLSYQDDVLTVWRRGEPAATIWIRDPHALSMTQRGSPMLHLMHAWTATRGRTLVHAAAVGGVLLVGPGGSGKSTCAWLAHRAGLPYIADDYCLVTADAVESLYCSTKVAPAEMARPGGIADGSGKSLVFSRPVSRAGLRAIVLPSITGDRRASLEAVAPAVAFRALAPSTLFQLPQAGGSTISPLAALVRRFPCYRLRLGDRADVPSLLESLL